MAAGRWPEALDRDLRAVEVLEDVIGDLVLGLEARALETPHVLERSMKERVVSVALLRADRSQLARMAVEDRAVGNPYGGEKLRVTHQEKRGLPVCELVDGEGMTPDDAPGRIAADQQQRQQRPAGDSQSLSHRSPISAQSGHGVAPRS